MPKREGYILWDEYFMGIALLSGQRSKDPSTQVGACIVNKNNKIMSVGYNGFPWGCDDDSFPWERTASTGYDTKYPYVCHGELNAILNSGGNSLEGCKIYVGLFPCNECAKAIIQCGIKEIIFMSDKYAETDGVRASKRMLKSAGVAFRQFESSLGGLHVSFNPDDI